jgi:hypothetical protein
MWTCYGQRMTLQKLKTVSVCLIVICVDRRTLKIYQMRFVTGKVTATALIRMQYLRHTTIQHSLLWYKCGLETGKDITIENKNYRIIRK